MLTKISGIPVPTFAGFRAEHAGKFNDFYMEVEWLKARNAALIHNAIEAGSTTIQHGDEIADVPTWDEFLREKQREIGRRIDERSREGYEVYRAWKAFKAATEAKNAEIMAAHTAIVAAYSAGLLGSRAQIQWAADIRATRAPEMVDDDRAFFVDQPSDASRWIEGNKLTTAQFVETYRPLFISDRKRRAA